MLQMQSAGTSIVQSQADELKQTIELARFHAQKALVTLKVTRSVEHTDSKGKIRLVFNYMGNLGQKAIGNAKEQKNPFLQPIEDGLLISELGKGHRLLFNKFNIFHNHLLVVTRQFERQTDKLNLEDLRQASLVAAALKGLFFFNGGTITGASQPHKHIQVLPQESRSLPIFAQLLTFVGQQEIIGDIIVFPHFNFLHGIVKVPNTADLPEHLARGYQLLYSELFKQNQKNENNYNLIACECFILMVPRSKEEAFAKLSINSLGFIGSLLFKNQALMEWFLTHTQPSQILEDITCTTKL